MDEPVRLIDDPEVSSALREELAQAAELSPPLDLSAGAARLDAAIQSGAAGGIASSALPWIGGAIAVALVAGALLWSASDDPTPPTPAASTESDPDPAPNPPPNPDPALDPASGSDSASDSASASASDSPT